MEDRLHLGRLRGPVALLAAAGMAGALACGGPAVAAAAKPAPAAASSPIVIPDFSGLWMLDESEQIILHPPEPGPNGLPRGWMGFNGYKGGEPPPLRPEIYAGIKAEEAKEMRGQVMDERTARCKAAGPFDMMSWRSQINILQRWDELVFLVQRERALPRHVYIGHKHPPADELVPTVNGHSIAHWEGDTLVVDTVGFAPGPWFMRVDFIPQTEQLHVVERMRLKDADTLLSTWTVTDPGVFTKPWTINLIYKRQPAGIELFESVCDAQNRGYDVQG